MSENQDNLEIDIDIDYEDEFTTEEEQNKINKLILENKLKNKINLEEQLKLKQIENLYEQNLNLIQAKVAAPSNLFNFYNLFFGKTPEPVVQPTINIAGEIQTAGLTDDKSLVKLLGIKKNVIVNNISGKKAWIILSPAPIKSISSVGIEKLGNIEFNTTGDYKCQESALSDHSSRDFDLDNSQIYYTVFFDCDGKWKTPYKNRKINTKKYNINLLERHVNDAIDYDFAPIKIDNIH